MDIAGAIIETATGVLDLLDRVELYVKRYVERRDLAVDNVQMHERALSEHEIAVQLVESIEQQNTLDDTPLFDRFIRSRLRVIKSRLQANKESLAALKDEVSNANAMNRVRRTQDTLRECGRDVSDFYSFVSETVLPSLKETIRGDQDVLESYVPGSNVPPNPPRLTLDYRTTETCEGRLKAAIMDGSRSGIVGVVAAGLGGVGKTCALRGLANHEDVKERFPDGVLYISLGTDSNVSDIINGLAHAVERTGGTRLSRTIRGMRTVQEASDKATRWFRRHKCLFLVDDIWWVNGITSDVLGELGIILHDESLLVYTTRDKRFLRGADKEVLFEAREALGDIAQRMLMTHGGLENDMKLRKEQMRALKGILDICHGLPLAIGIAGATLKEYRDRRQTEKEDALVDYYRNLCSKEESIIRGSADRYGELRLIVDSSLDVLKKTTRFQKSFDEMFSGLCILRKQQKVSGHVLQKLWSLDELREAREIAKAFDEVSLVQMTGTWNKFYIQLHDLVLEIAMQKASNRYEVQSRFGTLIDNYMGKEQDANIEQEVPEDRDTSGRKAPKGFSFLRSCVKKCFCSYGNEAQVGTDDTDKTGSERVLRSWWDVEDDGYIHDNLCRALRGAGETEELIWLLERAQWIVPRLQRGRINGLEQDLRIGMRSLEKNDTDGAEKMFFKLIGSAARMGCVLVDENAYQVWFQMYGRILWYTRHCDRTRRFVSEIEEHAPRPWVKPSVGFLDEAGGARSESISIERCDKILSVWNGDGLARILWTSPDEVDYVTEYHKMYGRMKTHVLSTVRVDRDPPGYRDGHSLPIDMPSVPSVCLCGAFSDNQKWLATGYLSGEVLVWDVVSEYKVNKYLKCNGAVYGVGMSGNGEIVAYALRNKRIFVWDVNRRQDETGNIFEALEVHERVRRVGMSFDGNRIVCRSGKFRTGTIHFWDRDSSTAIAIPSEMQSDDVRCVSISRDGKWVASGSWKGTIQIWDVDSATSSVRTVQSHIGSVNHVALSGDGQRIVSVSSDEKMRVWDSKTGVMIGHPLQVWENAQVSVSSDGKEVVTTASDDTFQVFNLENMNASHLPESYTEQVECVAYCGHDNRVVTGSRDGRVRLWNLSNGHLVGDPLEGHTRAVECVAISSDGARIVSGSADRSVRVWDANSGEAVAQLLSLVEGHHLSFIGSVAVNHDATRVAFSAGKIFVWDVKSGALTNVACDRPLYASVAMSADGSRIAFTSRNQSVTVWDVQTQQFVGSPLIGHTDDVQSVVLSDDGKRVVSGSLDCTVRVWDVESGRAIGDRFVHDRRVVQLQSGVDGSRIVSYDDRGHARMWDVARGQCVINSNDPEWTSALRRHGLARFQFRFSYAGALKTIMRNEAQILATTDKRVVRVGDMYFSEMHGSDLWPFCTIVG